VPTTLIPFIAFAAVLTVIPGPAIVLIMKSAVLRGRGSSILTASGLFTGDLVWATASVAGLTALLVTYRPAFEALRFIGAAYLIYLGVRLLFRRKNPDINRADPSPTVQRSYGRAYSEGLFCELSNPKTLVVFTSVIPPFLPAGAGPADVALFGIVFALVGLCTCLAYAVAFSASRRLAQRPKATDVLMRTSGGILTAFGVGLVVEGVREA
jgi:threonine/homoserine/homoserine lactone efflux protein